MNRLEDEKRATLDQFIDDSRKMLSPMQLAKLVIFQMKFERELLDRVRAFRERGHFPGNPGDSTRGRKGEF